MDLFGTKKRRAREELWKTVAAELSGQYLEAEGFFNRKNERIEATVHGVPLVLDTYAVSNGKTSTAYTRVRGNYLHGPGPKLSVGKERVVQTIAKLLGMSDREVGDPPFDKQFMIRAESTAIAVQLWSDAARALMLSQFPDASLTSNREGVSLVGHGVWDEREELIAGVELVAELAGRDLHGRTVLARVEGTLSNDTDGWPRVELDTGVRVVIRAEVIADRLAMVARASERGMLEPAVIAIVDGRVDPAQGAQLPPGAHVAAHGVRTATLMIEDSGTWLVFPGLEIEPERLRAGAELLGAIAMAPDAYR